MANKKRAAHEVQLNLDLPMDLVGLLADFCKETKMKRKAVTELALRRFLNEKKRSSAEARK